MTSSEQNDILAVDEKLILYPILTHSGESSKLRKEAFSVFFFCYTKTLCTEFQLSTNFFQVKAIFELTFSNRFQRTNVISLWCIEIGITLYTWIEKMAILTKNCLELKTVNIILFVICISYVIKTFDFLLVMKTFVPNLHLYSYTRHIPNVNLHPPQNIQKIKL